MTSSRPVSRPASVLLALLVTLLAGCGTDDASPSAVDGGATPTRTPAETPAETPELIAYAGGESIGYEVRSPEDVDGMQGAPEAFKRFIAGKVRRLAAGSTCTAPSEVIVEFLRTDGFATGGVNDCGGYQALWVELDGGWKEVDGTQEMEGCAVLEQYQVPSDLVDGRCYDYDAGRQRAYRQD